MNLLVEKGAEFVDMQSALVQDNEELAEKRRSNALRLEWLWPPELKQISRFRRIQMVHREYKFMEPVHPSKRGHAIIAEHIHRYLADTSNTEKIGDVLPSER